MINLCIIYMYTLSIIKNNINAFAKFKRERESRVFLQSIDYSYCMVPIHRGFFYFIVLRIGCLFHCDAPFAFHMITLKELPATN